MESIDHELLSISNAISSFLVMRWMDFLINVLADTAMAAEQNHDASF